MANIRNYISMTDRMTPTLRSILKSMDSTLKVMKDLDRAANNGAQSKAYKRAEKDLKRANNQLVKMGNYNKMVARSAADGERAYRRMGSAVSGAANKMRNLGASAASFVQTLASSVYLAQKLTKAVGGVMTSADTSRSQVARLGLYNTSAYSNEDLYGQVFATAMRTRSSLTDTADLANKILISGVYTGDSAASSAIGTAGLINKALVAGGGTEEENQRALRQLTQGLASGVLQGDELRSIREQTPYFAQVLAEGLAQVDEKFKGIGIGDLKKLGAQGEITAERVIKAMWKMQDEIDEDFAAMPKTFGQAMTSLSNIWQYFLWMLSDVDGPLGRINDKLWQFVDYLQSAEGLELLNAVAGGMNLISMGITGAMDAAGSFVVFLQENSTIAQAAFIAIGTAAVWAGVSTAAAWVAAAWPVMLVIGLVGLLAWAFLNAGYTSQQVVGAIIGFIAALGAVVWNVAVGIVDVVMWILGIIIIALIAIGAGVIGTVQIAVQMVLWAVNAIITFVDLLWVGFQTVLLLIKAGFQIVAGFMVDRIYDSVTTILDLLGTVASVIDSIFGTNLSSNVQVFTTRVDDVYSTIKGHLDAGDTYDSIEELWASSADRTASRWSEDSDWIITDNMKNLGEGAKGWMSNIWGMMGGGEELLSGLIVDPSKWYDSGNEWASGIVDGIGSFNLGLPNGSVLDMFNPEGVTVNGGYLDGIKSDVNIGDEDIKLLRDAAARDVLLQLQAITPVANVTFGDVRETADVGKIVEVIEQMVDEQMATALIS